ncbi:MAG: 3-isopropylmalate dehydratase [Bacteroidota bacterium]|jgi:3-isopropylmalate/(R)-2-methylmalate dehydratase small subunit|nr:3-isopropylmalate dehydratase [Ignavibacteria bacterium]MCU7498569.1 3-isopropylmalate dehydratase [Ignavibacteria bacterium]MCU7511631.1 3-isopropylmalate dehydratase [Ignavibacteria bacterium]MCU7519155.1 3-isopropylmalate dehydratase [Ignavibacteria bacterium]MCU7523785.1 3-isopropylmalate dehydratase [Ignavibacteria bacterium]
MNNKISGRAYVLGDNIDTDQIIPAEHLVYSTSDEEELKNYGRFALSGVPPAQAGLPEGRKPFVKEGGYTSEYTVIIGGSNFGCGSSREHAPLALNVAGLKAVVAESYARIFYRNSVDGGFIIPFETPVKLNEVIKTGDEVEVDLGANTITNLSDKKTYSLNSLGSVYDIVMAGGIFSYARKTGMLAK